MTQGIPFRYFTYLYIECLNTDESIRLSSIPEDFQRQNQASYEEIQPHLRSGPFMAFQNTQASQVSLSIRLQKDMIEENKYIDKDFMEVVHFFESLPFPKYANSVVRTPKIFVCIGGKPGDSATTRDSIRMRAVPNSADARFQKPLIDGIYSVVEIAFTFTEIKDEPWTKSMIRNRLSHVRR